MPRFIDASWPVLLGLLAAAACAADRESSAGVEVITRTVAVKDVCAWPNLAVLPDGSVVATIFNQPCHGQWEGDIECWATTDAGATWQLRGTPAPHEPTTNRMNVAAGVNAKGELIVLASGWSHRPPPPPHDKPDGKPVGHGPPAAPLPTWVCRSADGGRTWTRAEGVEPPSRSRVATASRPGLSDRIVPFGDVIRIGDGLLGGCFYAENKESEGHDSLFFTSADDGRSWQCAAVISRGDSNETAPLRIAGFDHDGGYPATVELADGRLLTAYYARRTPRHDGYHMATVLWRLPAK